MNSTLLTTERPAGSPHHSREAEPVAERQASSPEPQVETCEREAAQRRAAVERREAQLESRRALAEHEALRVARTSMPRLF